MAVRTCAVASIGYRVRALISSTCAPSCDVRSIRACVVASCGVRADALTGILSGFAAWDPSSVDQFHGEHEP